MNPAELLVTYQFRLSVAFGENTEGSTVHRISSNTELLKHLGLEHCKPGNNRRVENKGVNRIQKKRSREGRSCGLQRRFLALTAQCQDNAAIKEVIQMCDEDTARAALRAIGIPCPSQALIQSWIQANRADREFRRQESAPPTLRSPATAQSADRKVQHRRGYSKSRLEPSLREQGTLQRQHERRKARSSPDRRQLVPGSRPKHGGRHPLAGRASAQRDHLGEASDPGPLPQRGIQKALPRRASSVPAISTPRHKTNNPAEIGIVGDARSATVLGPTAPVRWY